MEQQKKILVIEDDEDVRYLIGESIKSSLSDDIEIEAYEDAETALARCQQEKYDLIITDFKLPKMDGFDFIKKIYEQPLNASCPMIFISGYFTQFEAAKHGKYFENLSFLDKPFETDHLMMHIKMKLYGEDIDPVTEE